MQYSLAERLLYGLPQPVIALLVFALLLGANALGSWAQRLWQKRTGKAKKPSEHRGFILSSVIGLLALLMGFTFSMAINTYNDRRELVVEEATSIQSAYMAAQSLADPFRTRLSEGLVLYADARIAAASATDPVRAWAFLLKSEAVQEQLWTTSRAAEQSAPGEASSSAAQRIDDVLNVGERRFDARQPTIPIGIHLVLLAYLTIAALTLGFTLAGSAEQAGAMLLFLFTIVLVLIIDIEQPTRGLIVESQRPMEKALQWMTSHPPAAIDRQILRERNSPAPIK